MFDVNVERALAMLSPDDVVLDVGGWACPFNRANYVMDAAPFETRGYYRDFGGLASQGGEREYFTRDRWIVRDICERTPYPFRDKEIDFVICSHVLEDVRDPLWVCSELVRIAKRGYIEMPSREAETSRGWEHPRLAGLSHHRWLIDIDPARGHVSFMMKYHMIHSHWRYSLPHSHLLEIPAERRVQWLFWEGGFTTEERILYGEPAVAAELEAFVRKVRPYPGWRLGLADRIRTADQLRARAVGKVQRTVAGWRRPKHPRRVPTATGA